jgi:hypothetical protein
MDRVLPVVADSWEQLRRCDVYRLLDQIAYDDAKSIADARDFVIAKRPDLKSQANEVCADLIEECGFDQPGSTDG